MKTVLFTLLVVFLPFAAQAQAWSPQPSGTTILLHGVWFVSSQRGWAVGDNGTSISTTDGGASWTPFTLTNQGLHDVAFLDQSTGLVVGDNGLVFRTTNGGSSWSATASGTANQLRAAAFGGGGAAYAAGRDGTILRSTNNGATWAPAGTGTVRYRGAAARGSSAWVVGEGGVINATPTSAASSAPHAEKRRESIFSIKSYDSFQKKHGFSFLAFKAGRPVHYFLSCPQISAIPLLMFGAWFSRCPFFESNRVRPTTADESDTGESSPDDRI